MIKIISVLLVIVIGGLAEWAVDKLMGIEHDLTFIQQVIHTLTYNLVGAAVLAILFF